jgi:hypothetical protein
MVLAALMGQAGCTVRLGSPREQAADRSRPGAKFNPFLYFKFIRMASNNPFCSKIHWKLNSSHKIMKQILLSRP